MMELSGKGSERLLQRDWTTWPFRGWAIDTIASEGVKSLFDIPFFGKKQLYRFTNA